MYVKNVRKKKKKKNEVFIIHYRPLRCVLKQGTFQMMG